MAVECDQQAQINRKRKYRVLFTALLVCSIGVAAYLNLRQQRPAERFETTMVRRGELVKKLADTGSVQLVRTVVVKSTITGKIRSLPVEVGDLVERGQVLAEIEPGPTQALQLSQQRAQVDRARLELKGKEKAFARKQQLYNNALATSVEFEEASIEWTKAQHNLQLAELELEILEIQANIDPGLRKQLDSVRILAPIDGLVLERDVEVGEVVTSATASYSSGTELFRIGDPSQLIIKAAISEIDAGRVRSRQAVDIVADAYPDKVYRGRVLRIAPVGERKQGSTIVTFDTDIEVVGLTSMLRQGMSCDIDIILSRQDDVLYLPVESVLEVLDEEEVDGIPVNGRGRYVAFVSKPANTHLNDSLAVVYTDGAASQARSEITAFPLESFSKTMLETGMETPTRIEILTGLKKGDRVATNPHEIKDRLERQIKATSDKDM